MKAFPTCLRSTISQPACSVRTPVCPTKKTAHKLKLAVIRPRVLLNLRREIVSLGRSNGPQPSPPFIRQSHPPSQLAINHPEFHRQFSFSSNRSPSAVRGCLHPLYLSSSHPPNRAPIIYIACLYYKNPPFSVRHHPSGSRSSTMYIHTDRSPSRILAHLRRLSSKMANSTEQRSDCRGIRPCDRPCDRPVTVRRKNQGNVSSSRSLSPSCFAAEGVLRNAIRMCSFLLVLHNFSKVLYKLLFYISRFN